MPAPTVSVIIPAYNAARFIGRTMDSVSRQSFDDLEIIVVDDGSTDDTAEIVLSHPDPRIRLIRQANASQAAARNRGIAASSAPYLSFLDADDLWTPDKLAKQVAAMGDVDLCCTDGSSIDLEDALIQTGIFPGHSGAVWEKLLTRNFIACSSVMLRRSALEPLDAYFRLGRQGCEDWDLWLRVAARGTVRHLAENLLLYRIHPGNISKRLDLMIASQNQVLEDAAAAPPFGLPPDLLAKKIRRAKVLNSIRHGHLCLATQPDQAQSYFTSAIRTEWWYWRSYWGLAKTFLLKARNSP
ncbi:MAG: hypothetical protein RL095_384 [Verrucomicrobiota bacterium]|jgi:glycosyltransferase involved in cell wall biosynthesis